MKLLGAAKIAFIAMRHKFLIFGFIIIAIALAVVFALIKFSPQKQTSSTLRNDVQSVVTKPMEFVKNRVTGGVGAVLTMDASLALPRIMTVVSGSPAQTAGLRPQDLILKVNDWPTTGQPLAQVVERIRGFTGATVAITVQRDATNLVFVLQRRSWNNLGVPGAAPSSSSIPSFSSTTNNVPIFRFIPNATNQQR